VSRVGKKPISIKDITLTKDGKSVKVKGKLGELSLTLPGNIEVEVKEGEATVSRPDDQKQNRALHGLSRALIQNMITGVTDGFSKTLNIIGVGYKAELKGKNLFLSIGYSHPIYFAPPDEITLEIPAPTQIIVKGIDKELVGLVAAKIRSFRKPEPYKGKGIRYSDEVVVKKAGKTAG